MSNTTNAVDVGINVVWQMVVDVRNGGEEATMFCLPLVRGSWKSQLSSYYMNKAWRKGKLTKLHTCFCSVWAAEVD